MNYWLLCIEWLQICLHAHSRSLYSSTLSCGVSYYLQDEVYSGLLRFHHTTTTTAGGGRVGRGEDVHLRSTTTTEQLLPELAKRFTLADSSSSSSSHCHIALVQGESRLIVSNPHCFAMTVYMYMHVRVRLHGAPMAMQV